MVLSGHLFWGFEWVQGSTMVHCGTSKRMQGRHSPRSLGAATVKHTRDHRRIREITMRRCASVLQGGGARLPSDSDMGVSRSAQVWYIYHPLSEKLGSCQHTSIHLDRTNRPGNALPIRSHPQPKESLVYQPFFHGLNITNVFKLHELCRRESWKLTRGLLRLARDYAIVDAF